MKRLNSLILHPIWAFFSNKAVLKGLKWLAALLLIAYIVSKLRSAPDGFSAVQNLRQTGHFAGLALLLVGANWGIETAKWRWLVRRLVPGFGWKDALRSVLIGVSSGMITPNRIGEYAGRVWVLPPGHRMEAAGLLLADRLSQMVATLAGGFAAIVFYSDSWFPQAPDWQRGLIPVSGALLCGGLLLFTFIRQLPFPQVASKLGLGPAWLSWRRIPAALRWGLVGASSIRFGIFCVQFWLLLLAFGQEVSMPEGLSYAAMVFWIKSILPSLALGEVGVRETVALTVAEWLSWNSAACVFAAFSLFVINLLLPSLLGLIPLLMLRSESTPS